MAPDLKIKKCCIAFAIIGLAAAGAGFAQNPVWTPLAPVTTAPTKPARLWANPATTFVGIGVSDPLHPLHVVGRGFISNPAASTDALSVTQTQASGNLLVLKQGTNTRLQVDHAGLMTLNGRAIVSANSVGQEAFMVDQTATSGAILNLRQAGGTKVLVDFAGKTGIGTPTPGAQLDVRAPSGLENILALHQNGKQMFVLQGADNGAGAYFAMFNTAGTIVNKLDARSTQPTYFNGGNVGIGTTNPQAKLDVLGGVRLTDGVNGTLALYGDSEGANLEVGKLQGGNRDFRVTDAVNGENLRVHSNGDVTVRGMIQVASVRTKTWTVAPDYVFEKDYKLRSLDDVDSFVKENMHLPEVPSAKEFKEKGMDLAEMNFLLLKKVEELTLHAIRQEKEMARQEQRMRSELNAVNRELRLIRAGKP